MSIYLANNDINNEDMRFNDSGITHTILNNKRFFSYLIMQKANVNTISASIKLIQGSRKVELLLLIRGT